MKTPQIRRLETALQKAGADGVLITRLARAERHTEISPGWYQPHLGFGYYGFSPGWYSGFYTAPRIDSSERIDVGSARRRHR